MIDSEAIWASAFEVRPSCRPVLRSSTLIDWTTPEWPAVAAEWSTARCGEVVAGVGAGVHPAAADVEAEEVAAAARAGDSGTVARTGVMTAAASIAATTTMRTMLSSPEVGGPARTPDVGVQPPYALRRTPWSKEPAAARLRADRGQASVT